MEWFKNYMFRLVIGCNDHCARNFIINKVDGKVYSIDDHCLDLDFEDIFNIKMKKDIKEKCKEYMVKNKDELLKILVKWLKCFKNENMIKRIHKLICIIG